jgi:pimeloyl-ACP methyl ester carboxylesterase
MIKTALSNETLLDCAKACVLSYQEELPHGFSSVGDLRIGILVLHGQTVVCIRGTANLMNFLRDTWAIPWYTGRHFAHRGFLLPFRELDEFLGPYTQEALDAGPVIFTGHSFGAAVATLFSEKYSQPAVTFGCPRVYARWSKPLLDQVRIICDDDPVPDVPKLMYNHKVPAITLKDGDSSWFDLDDHSMSEYLSRMEKLCLTASPG